MKRREAAARPPANDDPTHLAEFTVDGTVISTLEGRSLTGALHAAGITAWRRNLVTGETRAPFCGMGVCFECELTVDGTAGTRACLVAVHAGMQVQTEASESRTEAQP